MTTTASKDSPRPEDPRRSGRTEVVPRLALTLGEAAASLGVSERHLREMLTELPHCHLGRRVLVPVESLRKWLRERSGIEGDRGEVVAREIVNDLVGDGS